MEAETSKVYTVFHPSTGRYAPSFIPERFHRSVMTHLLFNHIGNEIQIPAEVPLLLAIAGPPGTGKSYMTKYICNQCKIPLYYLSASSLSSKFEGFPVTRLMETCKAAANDDSGRACILIDDIDTSIMSKSDDAKYTVNSQILSGALMNLCDNPCPDSCSTRRVPVIVTANNLTNLYQPLTRHGRMKILNWQPDHVERKEIIRNILRQFTLNDGELENLATMKTGVNGTSKLVPIAFFEQIKNLTYEQALCDIIRPAGNADFDELYNLTIEKHQNLLWPATDKLLAAAEQLLASHTLVNHLAGQCPVPAEKTITADALERIKRRATQWTKNKNRNSGASTASCSKPRKKGMNRSAAPASGTCSKKASTARPVRSR